MKLVLKHFKSLNKILVTLKFREHYSLLTSCLLACMLLEYCMFISTYEARINALLHITIF